MQIPQLILDLQCSCLPVSAFFGSGFGASDSLISGAVGTDGIAGATVTTGSPAAYSLTGISGTSTIGVEAITGLSFGFVEEAFSGRKIGVNIIPVCKAW